MRLPETGEPLGEEDEHPGYASVPAGSNHLVDLLKAIDDTACAGCLSHPPGYVIQNGYHRRGGYLVHSLFEARQIGQVAIMELDKLDLLSIRAQRLANP